MHPHVSRAILSLNLSLFKSVKMRWAHNIYMGEMKNLYARDHLEDLDMDGKMMVLKETK